MIPILYQTITEGSVPTHYGLGVLTDCLSCEVSEERNGAYELTLSYAAQGIHAADIQLNRYIIAKPNFTDNPQIFQIYRIFMLIISYLRDIFYPLIIVNFCK